MYNLNKKSIKIGIIGSGWVAVQRHIPAFKRLKNAKIEAIYSLKKDEAQKIADKFNIPLTFSNLDDFLNSDIQCVSICTPPFTHFELIKESLRRGKHVLVEKPMVMTAGEGQIVEKLSQEKKLILMPSHNFLFSKSMLKAKKIIKAGKLGDILGAAGIQWSSWRRQLPVWFKELPGGLFFDESPHLIYLLQYFLGELHINNVWKRDKIINKESFERLEVVLNGEKGDGVLSMWFGSPISEWVIYVQGTEGILLIDIFRDICYFFSKEKKRPPIYLITTISKASFIAFRRMLKWVLERSILRRKNLFGMDRIAANFINAVAGIEKPVLSPQDGYKVIEIINEIIKNNSHES
jgi:predicted dehydrogenase